jgi:hypothetical protein
LQKIKDDKSFEGFTSAEDDFGGDATEFDVGEGEADFGIGGTPAAEEDDPTA